MTRTRRNLRSICKPICVLNLVWLALVSALMAALGHPIVSAIAGVGVVVCFVGFTMILRAERWDEYVAHLDREYRR